MISARPIEACDLEVLDKSLEMDAFHTGATSDFFMQPGSACNVYEDERGPVMFVRGTKSLRLDIQFVSNDDSKRNAAVMLADFERFADQARQNGFTEIVFCSNSPGLRAFCKRRFRFREVGGELRKLL